MKKLLVSFACLLIVLSGCSSGGSTSSGKDAAPSKSAKSSSAKSTSSASEKSTDESSSMTTEELLAENQKLLDEMAPIKEKIIAFLPTIIPEENKTDQNVIDVTISNRDLFGAYIPIDARTDSIEQIKPIIDGIYSKLVGSEYKFDMVTFEVYNNGTLWGIVSRNDTDAEYSVMKLGEDPTTIPA